MAVNGEPPLDEDNDTSGCGSKPGTVVSVGPEGWCDSGGVTGRGAASVCRWSGVVPATVAVLIGAAAGASCSAVSCSPPSSMGVEASLITEVRAEIAAVGAVAGDVTTVGESGPKFSFVAGVNCISGDSPDVVGISPCPFI